MMTTDNTERGSLNPGQPKLPPGSAGLSRRPVWSWPWPEAIEAQAKGRRAAELEHAQRQTRPAPVTEVLPYAPGGYRWGIEPVNERSSRVVSSPLRHEAAEKTRYALSQVHGPRPDAATLRDQIARAVERTQWPSTGSDQVDHGRATDVTDAVMAILAEHGLTEEAES